MYDTISGPMSSMVRVSNATAAKTQMQAIGSIVIMAAINQNTAPYVNGDCDGDGDIEPPEWRTGTGPAGGGLLPSNIGAPLQDPWGTNYGYCVWDVGSVQTKCGGAAPNMLLGTPDPTKSAAPENLVIAVISAGPDRTFQTTCNAYSGTGGLGTETGSEVVAGGDDIVKTYTYEEAATALSSLWSLKTGDATQAVISKDLQVGTSLATVPAAVTSAYSNGIINTAAVVTQGTIIAGGVLQPGVYCPTCGSGGTPQGPDFDLVHAVIRGRLSL